MNNKVKSEQKLNLKKNQEISLTIEDFTKEGEGLGKYQGFPFFVKDTVIGDEVRVSITKLKKNYGYARLVEIVTPSKDRDPRHVRSQDSVEVVSYSRFLMRNSFLLKRVLWKAA